MAAKKKRKPAKKKPAKKRVAKKPAKKRARKVGARARAKKPAKKRVAKKPAKKRAKKRAAKKPAKKRTKITPYHGALHDHHSGSFVRNAHSHESAAAKRSPHGVIVIGRTAYVVKHAPPNPFRKTR